MDILSHGALKKKLYNTNITDIIYKHNYKSIQII